MGFTFITRVLPSVDAAKEPGLLAEYARHLFEIVVLSNREEMRRATRRGTPIPLLYQSGVRYELAPKEWKFQECADALTVLRRGVADCAPLSAYRIAELREAGEEGAKFLIKCGDCHAPNFVDRTLPRITMHVLVERANGTEEDPSLALGMAGAAPLGVAS